MGSPKVLSLRDGRGAEVACSSKGVIPPLFRADVPLAGAPSRFGPAQRTQALEAKRNPPTQQMEPQDGYRVFPGLQVRLDASISLRSAEAGC